MPLFRVSLLVMAAALAAACSPATPAAGVAIAQTGLAKVPDLQGTVKVPTSLLAKSVAPSPAPFGLLAIGEEVPMPGALVYLSDAQDRLFHVGTKLASAVADNSGVYRFVGSVPKKVGLIANAVLAGDRRLTGFTVVEDARTVDLSVASTYVTELLRQQAAADNQAMADYDVARLGNLVDKTQGLLQASLLDVPDLAIEHTDAMNRAYALAVGTTQDLGDAWATFLGRRLLAMQVAAGSGHAGAMGDGGPAASAELYQPASAVTDKSGNVFIADAGNHEIRRVDAKTGVITTVAGTGKAGYGGDQGLATQATLNGPTSVALDGSGRIYIADTGNLRIRRVDQTTGVITTVAGAPAPDGAGGWERAYDGDGAQAALARFYQPRAIAFDGDGDLFIADADRGSHFHAVRKLDMKTGMIATVVGIPGQPGAFDGDGGRPSQARLNFPNQLVFDSQGRLIIADTDNHCVRRVDFQGDTIVTVAGIGGQRASSDPDGLLATRTRLDAPLGVCVASDGRLFISESGGAKLVSAGADGVTRMVAGGGSDEAPGDARRVSLPSPGGVWIGPDGNLLAVDSHDARVWRLITRFGL